MVVIRLVVVDGDKSVIYDLLQQRLFSGTASGYTEQEMADRVRPHVKDFLEKYPEKKKAGA